MIGTPAQPVAMFHLLHCDNYRIFVSMSKPVVETSYADTGRSGSDSRRRAIMAAAFGAFMRYGFNRVTMDDIAREAGISRPALYRDFRNKGDIYAAIAHAMLDETAAAAEAVLSGDGSLEERLARAVEVGIVDRLAEISRSSHGAEILERKFELTQDAISGWHDRVAAALARAIEADAQRRGVDLSLRGLDAAALADALLDGLDGMKHRSAEPADWYSSVRRLARIVALAVG